MSVKVIYSSVQDLFDIETLDRADRVFLDRHCHGLIEWCALHPRRSEFDGLSWIKPRISDFDHIFIGTKGKTSAHFKQIRKLLSEDKVQLFLLKHFASEKEYVDARNIFDGVAWIEKLNEETFFVGLET